MVSVAATVMIIVSIPMVVVTFPITSVMVIVLIAVVIVVPLVLTVLYWHLLHHDPGLLDRDGLTMLPGNFPTLLQGYRDWALNWNILTVGFRNVKTFLKKNNG